MSPDLSIRATVVTIHYEAANNKTVQFSSLPLVGENSAVQTTVNRDDLFLLIGSMLSAAAFLLFVFAAILKRTFDFLPQTFLALGAFGFFYFRYLLFGICTFPYAAFALREFFAALIPFSAVCSLREHIKKISDLDRFCRFGSFAVYLFTIVCTDQCSFFLCHILNNRRNIYSRSPVRTHNLCDNPFEGSQKIIDTDGGNRFYRHIYFLARFSFADLFIFRMVRHGSDRRDGSTRCSVFCTA